MDHNETYSSMLNHVLSRTIDLVRNRRCGGSAMTEATLPGRPSGIHIDMRIRKVQQVIEQSLGSRIPELSI